MNEPAVYISLGVIKGTQPPGKSGFFSTQRIRGNLIKAHRLAYKSIHLINPSALASTGNSINFFIPHGGKNYNRLLGKIVSYLEKSFFKKIKSDIDYIAFQYYRSLEIGFKFGGQFLGIIENDFNVGENCTDLSWKIYPEGIYYFLNKLKKYNLPIYITENGIADAKDEKREKFIKDHLKWINKAIQEGIDVRGYFHWSLLDNFEFVEIRGFWPRFGLIEVDYETLERRIRPSAKVYAEICKNNEIVI